MKCRDSNTLYIHWREYDTKKWYESETNIETKPYHDQVSDPL